MTIIPRNSDSLELITPANRPDYRQLVAPLAYACWPEFMLHDPVADQHWGALFERFSDYQFGLLDPETGVAVAMGNSLPLHWDGDLEDLPERGWDWAFEQAVADHQAGVPPTHQCAIQVAILPDYRGGGISARMVNTMRSIGQEKGFRQLIAPVRPSQKTEYPLLHIDHYVGWKREDGLPFDAWLRVHSRLGARIIRPCHESMTICGTIAEWQEWTGLVFPQSGPYHIPGALNPALMNLASDAGIYIEPNVWMVHSLA